MLKILFILQLCHLFLMHTEHSRTTSLKRGSIWCLKGTSSACLRLASPAFQRKWSSGRSNPHRLDLSSRFRLRVRAVGLTASGTVNPRWGRWWQETCCSLLPSCLEEPAPQRSSVYLALWIWRDISFNVHGASKHIPSTYDHQGVGEETASADQESGREEGHTRRGWTCGLAWPQRQIWSAYLDGHGVQKVLNTQLVQVRLIIEITQKLIHIGGKFCGEY